MRAPDERTVLTRRTFLRYAAAAGALPSFGSLLAACGGDGGSETERVEQVERTRGGTLRVSLGSDVRGFDVARFYDMQNFTIADSVFNRLVKTDPQDAGAIQPDLAAEVPTPERDGTSYTFQLREARFHDGSPVTAEDVKFSIERVIHPETQSEAGFYYTGMIVDTEGIAAGEKRESNGIVVLDEKTIRFDLESPRATFLNVLALPWASILPKAVVEERGDNFNLEPIGSGPFRLDSYRSGQRAVFARFDDYFDPDAVWLDGIELSLTVNPDTAILRIDGGELDLMVDDVPPAAYTAIQNDPNRRDRLVEGPVDNVYYLTLNAIEDSPIFRHPDARRGIAMAIDKQRLVQQLQGRGEPATGYWSPASQYHDPDFAGIPHDPEQARSLIESAGVNGETVDLIVPAQGTSYPLDEFGPTLMQDLEEAGLNVNLVSLEFSAWLNRTMDAGALVPNGWTMDNPHGSYVVDSAFTTQTKEAADADGTCCNFSRWASPEVDRLNEIGNMTTDKDEEIAAYQEIMRTVVEEALWVPLYWPTRALYHADNVEGVIVPTNYQGMQLSLLSVTS